MRRLHHRIIPRSSPGWAFLLAASVGMLAVGACDQSFEPIEPSELRFSVFGYLDAAADTQRIRVMPLRPLITASPDPRVATVTLENLGTGRVVQLRDSVVRFARSNEEIGSDGMYVHNFWTAERIEPGATYRFSAKRDGEKPAEAVVKIPADYDVEMWVSDARGDQLRVAGLKHVALVHATTYFYDRCGSSVEQRAYPVFPWDSDPQMIPVVKRPPSRTGCGTPEIERRELTITGSGSPWPSSQDLSVFRLGSPNGQSNISNAVGFLGGVLTKVLPHEDCSAVTLTTREYCRLRYDREAATLRGTLRDTLCGGEVVARADLQLSEIEPVPPIVAKVRLAKSNRAGVFEFGALEAGRRYALTIRRLIPDPVRDLYEWHVDTLQFAAGEVRTGDIGLRRLFACGAEH